MNIYFEAGYYIFWMRLLVAVTLALSVAWLWDRFLRFLKWNQKLRVGLGNPLGEEVVKYSLAMAFQLQPWLVYLLFGLGEGVLEAFLLKRKVALKLIIAGGLIHLCFGLFFLFPVRTGICWAFAVVAHIFWNNLLIHAKS